VVLCLQWEKGGWQRIFVSFRILSYPNRETGEWALQSGFDGAELLTRPGIEFVSVEPVTIRTAESRLAMKLKAGDGDRTRDVQLGKMSAVCLSKISRSLRSQRTTGLRQNCKIVRDFIS
jgi:hypothetical protein